MKRLALVAIGWMGCQEVVPPSNEEDPSTWRAFLFTDTHIIASYYRCCESPGLDTISIYRGADRLAFNAEMANALRPKPELGFAVGDIFHDNYAYGEDLDAYAEQESAIGNAQALFDRFDFPIEIVFGNHDYDVPRVSREFSHQLFDRIMGKKPYYAVDHRGFRFLILNTQLGETWNPDSESYNRGTGSLGRAQLEWAADQLDDDRPTFVFFHHHPLAGSLAREELAPGDEVRDGVRDVYDLVEHYADRVQAVFTGHLHRWVGPDTLSTIVGYDNVPWYILGAVRYDPQNFWVLEMDEADGSWSIVDQDKAFWGTTWAYDTTYDEDGQPEVDFGSDPEWDPATQSTDLGDLADGWEPPSDP